MKVSWCHIDRCCCWWYCCFLLTTASRYWWYDILRVNSMMICKWKKISKEFVDNSFEFIITAAIVAQWLMWWNVAEIEEKMSLKIFVLLLFNLKSIFFSFNFFEQKFMLFFMGTDNIVMFVWDAAIFCGFALLSIISLLFEILRNGKNN